MSESNEEVRIRKNVLLVKKFISIADDPRNSNNQI